LEVERKKEALNIIMEGVSALAEGAFHVRTVGGKEAARGGRAPTQKEPLMRGQMPATLGTEAVGRDGLSSAASALEKVIIDTGAQPVLVGRWMRKELEKRGVVFEDTRTGAPAGRRREERHQRNQQCMHRARTGTWEGRGDPGSPQSGGNRCHQL